mmetsp:Transcript_45396/g.113825  ORF Transcript_45396/g.113825 Transcript_45396/m.113825 type:complete len:256 (+) Transcript_45396:188-955(+)
MSMQQAPSQRSTGAAAERRLSREEDVRGEVLGGEVDKGGGLCLKGLQLPLLGELLPPGRLADLVLELDRGHRHEACLGDVLEGPVLGVDAVAAPPALLARLDVSQVLLKLLGDEVPALDPVHVVVVENEPKAQQPRHHLLLLLLNPLSVGRAGHVQDPVALVVCVLQGLVPLDGVGRKVLDLLQELEGLVVVAALACQPERFSKGSRCYHVCLSRYRVPVCFVLLFPTRCAECAPFLGLNFPALCTSGAPLFGSG